MNSARLKPRHWLALACALAALAVLAWYFARTEPAPRQSVRLAIPSALPSGTMLIAMDQDLFGRQGLDVQMSHHGLGTLALKEVIEGRADLAVVADTPFMFGVMRGERIAVLGSVMSSRHGAAILARRDRGVARMSDLEGKTLGLPLGSNMQYFADVMLLTHKVPPGSVQLVDLKADEIVSALESGRVDAVASWNPYLAELEQHMVGNTVRFSGEEMFTLRFLLVGRQDYIATHGDAVRRVLAAANQATHFVHQNPDEARRVLAGAMKVSADLAEKIFEPRDYELRLDEALLMALDDQTRWATRRALVQGSVPNYLHYLHLDSLATVAPRAVTVIH